MNKVILIGRLAKDVELRTTSSGKNYADFTLAVNREYNKENKSADFIECVTWNNSAVNLSRYCGKGSQVAIEGKINVNSYTTRNGEQRYTTKVIADSITFLDTKKKENKEQEAYTESILNSDPFQEFSDEIEVNEDDLPF